MIKKKKAKDEKDRLDFITKLNAEEEEDDQQGEDKTETDSSLRYEKQKREEFNSELDIYSEVDSSYFRTGMNKRRNTVDKRQ